MKYFLLFFFFIITSVARSQPKMIYYGKDSLLFDQTLIMGTESKSKLDRLMQSESKNGIILSSYDQIFGKTETIRKRNFDYKKIGVTYRPHVKEPADFDLYIRFEYEPDELKLFKVDSTTIYKGMLVIGNQFFNAESGLEKILKNPSFSLIKKGTINTRKLTREYVLISFEDILIKLYYNPINGHLKHVELLK